MLGFPVKTPLKAIVEKIHVSPYGYGNALFLRSSEGIGMTFAHLNDFDCKISELENLRGSLELLQHKRRQFLRLSPWFSFSQKECIGHSGESGSGAPHLHFEVEKDQIFYNPLLINGLEVKDHTAPVLTNLYISSQDSFIKIQLKKDRSLQNLFTQKDYYLPIERLPRFRTNEKIQLLIGVYDTIAARNKNGIYSLRLSAKGINLFSKELGKLKKQDFSEAAKVYQTFLTQIGKEYVYYLGDFFPGELEGLYPNFTSHHKSRIPSHTKKLPIQICAGDAAKNIACLKLALFYSSHLYEERKETESQQEKTAHPETPYVKILYQERTSIEVHSGEWHMKSFFHPRSLHQNGYMKLWELAKMPIRAKKALREQKETNSERSVFNQSGPVFAFRGNGIYYRDRINVEAVFPSVDEGALYYFNESLQKWSIIALPKRKKAGKAFYKFQCFCKGMITQLQDLVPPRIYPAFLWQSREQSPKNTSLHKIEDDKETVFSEKFTRWYHIQDRESGFNSSFSSVHLDGQSIPYKWDIPHGLLKISFPTQIIPKRGSVLSICVRDLSGNQAPCIFEFLNSNNPEDS